MTAATEAKETVPSAAKPSEVVTLDKLVTTPDAIKTDSKSAPAVVTEQKKEEQPAKPAENTAPAVKPTEKPTPIAATSLKLPTKSELSTQDLERIAADATARGLTPEQAQAEVDLEHKVIARFVDRHEARIADEAKRLIEAAKADPEIGGLKLEETKQLARSVLTRFDREGKLTAVLEETGLGNDPEVLRILRRIGESMRSEPYVPRATPQPADMTLGQALFGKPGVTQ